MKQQTQMNEVVPVNEVNIQSKQTAQQEEDVMQYISTYLYGDPTKVKVAYKKIDTVVHGVDYTTEVKTVDLPKWVSVPTNCVTLITKTLSTFYKDGNKAVSIEETLFRLVKRDGEFVLTNTGVTKLTTLKVNKCGRMSLTLNGKLVYKGIHNVLAKLRSCFKRVPSRTEYLVSRSPLVRGANFGEVGLNLYYSLGSKQRARVYYLLKKGDVKGARQELFAFKGASKSVVNRMKALAEADTYHAVQIKTELHPVTPEKIEWLSFESSFLWNGLVVLGKFPGVLKSMKKSQPWLIRDTCHLLEYADESTPYTSLKELHDDAMLARRKAVDPDLPELPTLHELPVLKVDGYTVHSCNSRELEDIGRAMSICVGMYKRAVWLGSKQISVVKRQNKYIACLEWVEVDGVRYLIQAKLSCNRKVVTDDKVWGAVMQWAETYSFKIATSDMGEEYPSKFLKQESDPERLAILGVEDDKISW